MEENQSHVPPTDPPESSSRQEQIPNNGSHRRSTYTDRSTPEIKQHPIPITTPPLPPVEFPKFSGDDFSVWLYRCNRFFEIYSIPDQVKVNLASIYLEGEALRWHQKFMKKRNNSATGWEEYENEMSLKFGNQIIEIASGDGTESTELIKTKQRLIRRLQSTDENCREARKPKEDNFRFGPIYCTSEEKDPHSSLKEEAWKIVLKKSPWRPAETTEVYSTAVRKIENEAKECYEEGATDLLTEPQFLWMMIRDGCFFLHLVLHLLGVSSAQLGYPHNHNIFGKSNTKYKDFKEWIEAMFFVGNQIPFVVLKVLLKQKYFQNVIKEGKWDKPLDISKIALYELLLFPELERQSWVTWKCVKGLWRRVFDPRIHWLLHQEANDLLHGFQLLILGPEKRKYADEDEDDDDDEEDNIDDYNYSLAEVDDMSSPPATDLDQEGMCFCNCYGIGSRRIRFINNMFCCCYGCAILCLPPIRMSDDTELMFRCLVNYEISQKLSIRKREFCSYVRFMSELIKSTEDARIMAKRSIVFMPPIIKGNSKQKHKLPGMLRKMASKETYNYNIRRVKVKIADYTTPLWKKYWQVLVFSFMLAVTSLTFSILTYFKKKTK